MRESLADAVVTAGGVYVYLVTGCWWMALLVSVLPRFLLGFTKAIQAHLMDSEMILCGECGGSHAAFIGYCPVCYNRDGTPGGRLK